MHALLWQEKTLSLLDQRKYPGEELWYECRDWRQVVMLFQSGAVNGEDILSIAGAYAYCLAVLEADSSDLSQQINTAKAKLLDSRPESTALRAALLHMDQVYEQYQGSEELITALLAAAVTLHRQDVIACRSMNRHGRDIVPAGGNIVVSCTGSCFHTGGIGGVLGMLLQAMRKQGLNRVYVCEHRPGLEGATFAHELARLNVPVSLIADHSAATLMPRQSCDMVLLEGLQAAASGDLLAAPGSYALAIAAYYHSIPVYATIKTDGIQMDLPDGAAFPKGEGDTSALVEFADLNILPEGAEAWMPDFDLVPAQLLTGLVTEKGLAFPAFSESLPELLAKKEDKSVLFL